MCDPTCESGFTFEVQILYENRGLHGGWRTGRCCPHLSLEERRKIAKWREGKMPVPEIADRLGRAASSIYREIKRNVFDDTELPELSGYYAVNLRTCTSAAARSIAR